jgi:hypothetical protein
MLKFIQFKKEKQLYTNHYQFSKSGSEWPKPTVMITITVGFILKTDNDNEIKKNKSCGYPWVQALVSGSIVRGLNRCGSIVGFVRFSFFLLFSYSVVSLYKK